MHTYTHTHIHTHTHMLLPPSTYSHTVTLYTTHMLSHTLIHVTVMEMHVYHTHTYNHIYNSIEREVTPTGPTLWDPMDGNLPGSSVHRIFQARVLEWVAISSSRRSSQPRG